MSELLLIVTIAGQRVALPADAVESVVELDTLIPVPRAAPHVAGLSALRSRVLTVIDCMRSLELGATDCADGIREAAVVELDGHHYALLVDLVEDVVEAAGYRVVAEGDESADVVIVADGAKVDKGAAGRTIRLRAEPEAAGAKDHSIYRYDRAALLMALKSAGGAR